MLRRQRWDKIFAVTLVLFWIVILLIRFYFPGVNFFEADLNVSEMSFSYTKKNAQLFLDTINSIKRIDIEGRQNTPITLTGNFSIYDSSVKEIFTKSKEIEIELPSSQSHISFTSTDSNSQLSVSSLSILEESRINQLTYNADLLSFCLQSSTSESEKLKDCLYPERMDKNRVKPVGYLTLDFGEKPLKVDLEEVNIPRLNITSDKVKTLSFTFKPDSTKSSKGLPILSPTHFYIQLPNTNKEKDEITDLSEIIWGDIDVEDVEFKRFNRRSDPGNKITRSTIINGKVRVGSQVIQIDPNQFLIVSPQKTGINKLYNIELDIQSHKGIHTRISGESQGLGVGFSENFPVQKIETSWLLKHFSPEDINAILAFIGALTGIFLPRLFT